MADDTSLLFRIRGDASGAKAAVNESRTAIKELKDEGSSNLNKLGQSGQASLKQLEASIKSVKERIKEVKAEAKGEIPFKTERLEGLRERLRDLTGQHRELRKSTEDSARAFKDDFGGALQTLSPRLAAFAGAGGPLTLAAAGFVATTVAIAGTATALFGLAKSTAETAGSFQDLSQQTGVSVETLSALDIVAQTVGGSIQSVAASLGIFQKNLEESLDTNSKAAKTFEQLGVQVTDTEQTLRDTLEALARMPEGFRQTSLALELFGRGGKEVLAILKDTRGDLDGTIEKLRGLGLVTGAQALAADEFNDRLVLLGVSLRGLGSEIIPLVNDAIKDLQKTIKDNKEAVDLLKLGLQAISALFVGPLKGAIFAGNEALKQHKGEIQLLTEAYQILRTAIQGAADEIPKQPLISSADKEGLELLREIARFGVPLTEKQDFSKVPGLFKEGPKSAAADPAAQLLQQLQRELRGLEDATRAEEVAAELLDTRFKSINPKIREQILLTARIIDTTRDKIEIDRKATEVEERRERERKTALENLNQFLRRQVEELNQLRGVTKTAFDEVEDLIHAQIELGQKLDDNQIFWLRFNASMIEAAKGAEKLKKLLEDIGKIPPPGKEVPRDPNAPIVPDFAPPPPNLKPTFDVIKALKETYLDLAASIAHGTASMVEQWVLLGTAGPNAIRKMTAQVLAGLAAQATAKAVFELAEGFAALAGFLPGPAALHFKAAAFYGATAAVAGAVGRSIAGDLFKPTGSAGAGTSGGSIGSGQLNPLALNRNQPQRIVVEFRADDSKFGQAITAHIIEDGETAGPIRQFQADDGRF